MPNTNFQTIHQMGQAINEVVRQATGRDAVQNIDMDHVTVAQTRYFEDATASGSMVSFTDSVGGMPLEKCVVQIEPVQDLHGFDRPWAGGSQKNKLRMTLPELKTANDSWTWNDNTASKNGITVTVNTDSDGNILGYIANAQNASASTWFVFTNFENEEIPVDGTMKFGGYLSSNGNSSTTFGMQLYFKNNNGSNIIGVTVSNNYQVIRNTVISGNINANDASIVFRAGLTIENLEIKPMILLSSETDYEFSPYSNICPITGWTGANIHVSPTTDAQDGTTYSITFPAEAGTVYGGTLEVIKGVLTVADGHIASYNGEALPGKWISDRDVYAEGTSPTTGAEVVYERDNPITYQTTSQEILTLEGQNNIWANTGDIEVTYKVLGGLY